MSTILQKIIDRKVDEIKELKQVGFHLFHQSTKPTRRLYDTLKKADRLGVIAEIKRASPSKGDIKVEVDPVQQAKAYERAGAAAISVLTDTPFFKGRMEDLALVRKEVSIPILCKDFILDRVQIDRAKDAGADIILLIVAALDRQALQSLYQYAEEQGLEVLVEVHDESEMKTALELGAKIIGINNRNLKTFEVKLDVTERLARIVSDDEIVLISESGIGSPHDSERVSKAGAHGVLVGETLMRSEDAGETLASLRVQKDERQ
ncbi:indole-3-glycerol phosphate synthase TrpC [Rossellomorea aquimaris]|uniref:indole-3-glycerol phosphate synthase TrpC n=1 Tax=Rossellomorea aquimaris TaxID=189382 RepID=UPI001CD1EAE8|nr:indole-3-glycerol phosphate synthase TrpC [Rossellomorea aquimaris]MCA1054469.1 indole-3-glycerol phosphate synthase TrpC [Rossellomorea aquimaris]